MRAAVCYAQPRSRMRETRYMPPVAEMLFRASAQPAFEMRGDHDYRSPSMIILLIYSY
jgi:hypothetical protein